MKMEFALDIRAWHRLDSDRYGFVDIFANFAPSLYEMRRLVYNWDMKNKALVSIAAGIVAALPAACVDDVDERQDGEPTAVARARDDVSTPTGAPGLHASALPHCRRVCGDGDFRADSRAFLHANGDACRELYDDGDADFHAQPDGDFDADGCANRDGDRHPDADGDFHAYDYAHANRHADGYAHADFHPDYHADADDYAHADHHAHAGAARVRLREGGDER